MTDKVKDQQLPLPLPSPNIRVGSWVRFDRIYTPFGHRETLYGNVRQIKEGGELAIVQEVTPIYDYYAKYGVKVTTNFHEILMDKLDIICRPPDEIGGLWGREEYEK